MSMQHCLICRCNVANINLRKAPKDAAKRKLWSDSTGVPLTEFNRVCDLHFEEKDFYYGGEKKRRRLVANAVPRGLLQEPEHTASGSTLRFVDAFSQTEKEVIDGGLALENMRLQRKVLELQKQNKELMEKIKKFEQLSKSVREIFTESQVRKLESGGRPIQWANEDISIGVCLHAAGPRAYRHLVKKGFPLPNERTLQRWSNKLDVQPGPLDFIFELMENAIDFSEDDKICVLSFDEMKVASTFEYDHSQALVPVPVNYVQVAMVHGLKKSWKQPIFFDYNTPMTVDILYDIIKKLYKAGYPVVALVSDLGPTNTKLRKSLGVTPEQSWFAHPSDAAMKVFVFADTPRLIELVRNHFLDSGLLVGGNVLTSATIEQSRKHTSKSDLSIMNKITDEHLNVRGSARQKVKLATQLFSNTTASTIRRCHTLGHSVYKGAETADFVKLVNDWFDIYNSKLSTSNSIPAKRPFGQILQKQLPILEKMTEVMSVPVVPNENRCLPFQQGIIANKNALVRLQEYLLERFNITYILTSRLQQDELEHFFEAMRAKGGLNDHPSPLEFKIRLRKYILGHYFAVK